MPEGLYQVVYSKNAIHDSIAIKKFILQKFTQREVNNFYKLLMNFEKNVATFPLMYATSKMNNDMRRAVLSKPLSVFYAVDGHNILIIGLIDNRMDYSKWP